MQIASTWPRHREGSPANELKKRDHKYTLFACGEILHSGNRFMMPPGRPRTKLSIVIAAWNGLLSLERCLRSLKTDGEAPDIEVIVVTNFDAAEMLKTQFPYVQHVAASSHTTVPVLRTTGVFQAGGEIVALAEDHCTFGDGWCSEVKKAHQLPYSVIGGPVENASGERALDWAVYFYDYGRFMLPSPAAVVEVLPGNNVSFKRSILQELEPSLRAGFFEAAIKHELEKRELVLYLAPSVVVYHCKHYKVGKAIRQCYHLARAFAGKRVLNTLWIKRAALVLGSLALPMLLPGRIVTRTVRKRRHIKELVRSLPYLLTLLTSWSFGEFCGYCAGEGSSASKWK